LLIRELSPDAAPRSYEARWFITACGAVDKYNKKYRPDTPVLQLGNETMSTEGTHHRMERAGSWLHVRPLTVTKELVTLGK
jgi:hypothetical protein